MLSNIVFLLLALFGLVASQNCDKNYNVERGNYRLYNNLWNQDAGSGRQCTYPRSADGNNIAWTATWTWFRNEGSAKSYANVVKKESPRLARDISTIPTNWNHKYTCGGGLARLNVAYDFFFSRSNDDNFSYELMIWVYKLGNPHPIGNKVGAATLLSKAWTIWKGEHNGITVITYMADQQHENFHGNIGEITWHAVNNNLIQNHWLRVLHAGTEAFAGNECQFVTENFNLAVL